MKKKQIELTEELSQMKDLDDELAELGLEDIPSMSKNQKKPSEIMENGLNSELGIELMKLKALITKQGEKLETQGKQLETQGKQLEDLTEKMR